MRKLLLIGFACAACEAFAATAYFTGRQEMVQTVTNQMGWKCQYQYAGNYFWRVFLGQCPVTVEIQ